MKTYQLTYRILVRMMLDNAGNSEVVIWDDLCPSLIQDYNFDKHKKIVIHIDFP